MFVVVQKRNSRIDNQFIDVDDGKYCLLQSRINENRNYQSKLINVKCLPSICPIISCVITNTVQYVDVIDVFRIIFIKLES